MKGDGQGNFENHPGMVAMFHHVGLEVREMERSIRFYTDFFGFRLEKCLRLGEEEIAFLRRDALVLELVENGRADGTGSCFISHSALSALRKQERSCWRPAFPKRKGSGNGKMDGNTRFYWARTGSASNGWKQDKLSD
jgi:catechol 2,3-dioxygenase-like lactoylglutathione lyase family enzyme